MASRHRRTRNGWAPGKVLKLAGAIVGIVVGVGGWIFAGLGYAHTIQKDQEDGAVRQASAIAELQAHHEDQVRIDAAQDRRAEEYESLCGQGIHSTSLRPGSQ